MNDTFVLYGHATNDKQGYPLALGHLDIPTRNYKRRHRRRFLTFVSALDIRASVARHYIIDVPSCTVNKIWAKHVSIINTPRTHLLDMSMCIK